MNRKYVIEFYALSKFNNEYLLNKYFTDTEEQVDKLIEQGKKENKKHLRITDNLQVYIKDTQGEVLDSFTFEL